MLELVLLTIALSIPLVLITVGQNFVLAGSPDNSWHRDLASILVAIRGQWVQLVLPFFFGLASVVFFWSAYRTKLFPRFLAVLGVVGSVLVVAGIPMDFFGFKPGAFVGALMGLTEISLGIWLLVRGFSAPRP